MENVNPEEPIVIKVSLDYDEAASDLEYFASLEPGSLLSLFDAIDTGVEPFHIDSNQLSTGGAINIRVSVKFSDFFAKLIAALRAGNR